MTEQPDPIIVFGARRSGTTYLLERIRFSSPARDCSAGATELAWRSTFTEQHPRSPELIVDRFVGFGLETGVSLEALGRDPTVRAKVSAP